MKWTKAAIKPSDDMMCLVAIKRDDGKIIYDESYFTLGLRIIPSSPLREGFMRSKNVVAWSPIPKPYTRNKAEWILVDEKYPDKNGVYLVSIYERGNGRERVVLSAYDEKEEMFYKSNDIIAWMKIPDFKI